MKFSFHSSCQSLTIPQHPGAVGLTAVVPQLVLKLLLGVVAVVDGLDGGLVGDVHGGGVGGLHDDDCRVALVLLTTTCDRNQCFMDYIL